MIIALATPRVATDLEEGFASVERLVSEAARHDAAVVCFPEAYLPGLRGQDFEVFPFSLADHDRTLERVSALAGQHRIGVILGMERPIGDSRQIVSYVFDSNGQMLGYQTKNQIDPSEDRYYVPGNTRRTFTVNGLTFGIAICHEGWRYPETVRWAAVRGAQIVFHPQHTGNEQQGIKLTRWGSPEAPYYEKAMIMRSKENTIYFASVNYALRFQESATTLIDPSGECQAFLPYGEEGVLIQKLDLDLATGLLAQRYAPERYQVAP